MEKSAGQAIQRDSQAEAHGGVEKEADPADKDIETGPNPFWDDIYMREEK